MNIGWEQLGAYIDRELAPAEAAEVAAAIARDPDLAARVATLSRLKAGVINVDPQSGAMPPPFPALRPRPSAWPAAVAACAVFALVGLAALWQWLPATGPERAWLEDAAAEYQSWVADSAAEPGDARIRIGLQAHETEQVPDLSAAKLSLVHVSLAPGGAGSGLFLGYQGIHGCRLGLWIGATEATLAEQPTRVAPGDLEGYVWRVGETSYALLARGMDPARLQMLAEAVSRITHQQQRLDESGRIALRATTGIGAPCVG